MITVKVRGGLGNQMFQYATGRMLACANATQLELDLSWFRLSSPGTTPRKYELGPFNISAKIASFAEIAIVRAASTLPLFKHQYRKEKFFEFDPDILKCGDHTYLDGYWQSHKYFNPIREMLLQDFTLKQDVKGVNKSLADEITQTETSVSIHVRRGDYVTNPNNTSFHGICSSSYYLEAVEEMQTRVAGSHFYVFSDDPEWVRENLPCDGRFTIVDYNTPDEAAEDLRLMALCRHHIIANSTFSWWGAWLCRNSLKNVIAPRNWFNDPRMNSQDLVPETWIRI